MAKPMAIKTVRVSVLLAQTSAKGTKISFRSKPDITGVENGATIDMNVLAQRFGGGGHVHAAGAHVDMDADGAKASGAATSLRPSRNPPTMASSAAVRSEDSRFPST